MLTKSRSAPHRTISNNDSAQSHHESRQTILPGTYLEYDRTAPTSIKTPSGFCSDSDFGARSDGCRDIYSKKYSSGHQRHPSQSVIAHSMKRAPWMLHGYSDTELDSDYDVERCGAPSIGGFQTTPLERQRIRSMSAIYNTANVNIMKNSNRNSYATNFNNSYSDWNNGDSLSLGDAMITTTTITTAIPSGLPGVVATPAQPVTGGIAGVEGLTGISASPRHTGCSVLRSINDVLRDQPTNPNENRINPSSATYNVEYIEQRHLAATVNNTSI